MIIRSFSITSTNKSRKYSPNIAVAIAIEQPNQHINPIFMSPTQQQTHVITNTLSPVRLGTYLSATGFSATATPLEIYIWNALVSSAFFSSLHICEVVIRNTISGVLELKYGPDWPWHNGFERTLPERQKRDLQMAREDIPLGATGKVIAELKFVFWCKMFTARQDAHLWNSLLHVALPFLPTPLTVASARTMLYNDMEELRRLRNRIAHHEPIFSYPLESYHQRLKQLIGFRCRETHAWLAQWEIVSTTLMARP